MKASFRPCGDIFTYKHTHTHTQILHRHESRPIQFSHSCSWWISIEIIHFYLYVLSLFVPLFPSAIIIHKTEAFFAPRGWYSHKDTHPHTHITQSLNLRQQKRPNDSASENKDKWNKALNRAAGDISSQKHYSICKNSPPLCCDMIWIRAEFSAHVTCNCLTKMIHCFAYDIITSRVWVVLAQSMSTMSPSALLCSGELFWPRPGGERRASVWSALPRGFQLRRDCSHPLQTGILPPGFRSSHVPTWRAMGPANPSLLRYTLMSTVPLFFFSNWMKMLVDRLQP